MPSEVIETVRLGSLRVDVVFGTLTALGEPVGAIVSPNDAMLSARAGAALAIRQAAASSLVDRSCAEFVGYPHAERRLTLGEVRQTPAGALPAQAIFHAVVLGEGDVAVVDAVRDAAGEALALAERQGLTSVAMPVPSELSDGHEIASALYDTIVRFANSAPTRLGRLLLVSRSRTNAWQTFNELSRRGHRRHAEGASTPAAPARPASPDLPPPSARTPVPPSARALAWHPPTPPTPGPPAPLASVASVLPVPATPAPSALPVSGGPAPSTWPIDRIPRPVLQAARERRLVLFVGSGLSMGADVVGNFPAWSKLPERLLEACYKYDTLDAQMIEAKRASFELRMGLEQMLSELGTLRAALGRDYQRALNDIFRPKEAAPGAAHHAAIELDAPAIVTTNYDHLFELVPGSAPRQVYTWKGATKALSDLKDGRHVLFKIHGSAEDHESIVMSTLEYDRTHADPAYRAVLQHLLQTYLFLFVGYGMNDPLDLDAVFRTSARDFREAAQPHYALLRKPADADVDRLKREYNARVIRYAEHGDVIDFLRALAAAAKTP